MKTISAEAFDHILRAAPLVLLSRPVETRLAHAWGCCGMDDAHLRAFAKAVRPRPADGTVGHRPHDRDMRQARAVATIEERRSLEAAG